MLTFTKEMDYAILALCYLATQEKDRVVNTKEIANYCHVPIELLAKILQSLGRNGLVISRQGPTGGYLLAKEPSDITISDIITSVKSASGIVSCLSEKGCAQISTCSIKRPMQTIHERVVELLDNITLEELTKREFKS